MFSRRTTVDGRWEVGAEVFTKNLEFADQKRPVERGGTPVTIGSIAYDNLGSPCKQWLHPEGSWFLSHKEVRVLAVWVTVVSLTVSSDPRASTLQFAIPQLWAQAFQIVSMAHGHQCSCRPAAEAGRPRMDTSQQANCLRVVS